MDDITICPRCAYWTVEKLFSSPVPGVWDVQRCRQCLYTWRTSEPARRTRRDAYSEAFRVTLEDIRNASEAPRPAAADHRDMKRAAPFISALTPIGDW